MMSEDEFEVLKNQIIEETWHVDRGDTPKHAQAGCASKCAALVKEPN
jgi:glutamate formiminotransferase